MHNVVTADAKLEHATLALLWKHTDSLADCARHRATSREVVSGVCVWNLVSEVVSGITAGFVSSDEVRRLLSSMV